MYLCSCRNLYTIYCEYVICQDKGKTRIQKKQDIECLVLNPIEIPVENQDMEKSGYMKKMDMKEKEDMKKTEWGSSISHTVYLKTMVHEVFEQLTALYS